MSEALEEGCFYVVMSQVVRYEGRFVGHHRFEDPFGLSIDLTDDQVRSYRATGLLERCATEEVT